MPDEHPLGSVARRLAATQRVLVVEDEQDIVDFLRAYFRASGYDLVSVDPDTAEDVCAAVDEHDPDCVLLDLNLRGFNGADAYRLLRTEPRHAYLPVIVVSARPDAQTLVPARGGIDAFVTKPFHVKSLADLVVERIASAQRLAAKAVVHEPTGLPGHDYVEARLLDELTVGGPHRPTAFALARLRGVEDIRTQVGEAGLEYVQRDLVRRLTTLLPAEACLGVTNTRELAVMLPGTAADDAARLLTGAAEALAAVTLPGGAEVPVAFAVGLAAFPTHAADADALYMAADAALADAVERHQLLSIAL